MMAMNKKELIKVLSTFVTPSRALQIQNVAKERCHTVQILLENINDRGNENAIIRTMDGMGIHMLHRLHNSPDHKLKYENSTRTDKGSKRWITTRNWSNTIECVQYIKKQGYMLVGTDCKDNASLDDIDLKGRKVVFGFGNEANGMSSQLLNFCDATFKLPMYGFVHSYNVATSVAMTLYHVMNINKFNPPLSSEEQLKQEEETIISIYSSLLGHKIVQELMKETQQVL